MLDSSIHSVFIPVEDLVSNGIIDTSKIAFPERICIDQYCSATNLNRALAALKEIKKLNVSRRETNLTENAKIIRQTSTLNNCKPHTFSNCRDRNAHWSFQGFGAVLFQKNFSFLFKIFLFNIWNNVGREGTFCRFSITALIRTDIGNFETFKPVGNLRFTGNRQPLNDVAIAAVPFCFLD